MSWFSNLRQEYFSTLKSSDTEEHIDLYFYRPLGFCVAKLSSLIGITPNVITIISIFLGVGAGIAFYFNDLAITALGILLLVSANTLDSADGQLARMTHNYSRLGRILDGLAGDLWFITIYFAIVFRVLGTSQFFGAHPWALWILAVAAGLSHIKQAQMADFYRQVHLKFLSGNTISELEDIDDLRKKYAVLSWKDNFSAKLVLLFYMSYTKQQAMSSPMMYKMLRLVAKRQGPLPEGFAEEYRRGSLPMMKFTNFLSFNWRSFFLFASLLVKMPWIYFVVELTLFNAALLYMNSRYGRLAKRLIPELQ